MLTYPFEILKKRLTEKVTELREIDWYMNQDDTGDKNADITAAPVLLLEVTPFQTRDLGFRIQQATIEFDAILLTETLAEDGSKRMKKDEPSDHMAIFEKVFGCLSGFSAKVSYLFEDVDQDLRVFNSISRISIVPPHKYRKAMMRSRQRFRFVVWDHSSALSLSRPNPLPLLCLDAEMPRGVTADQETWSADTTTITADRT